MMKVPKMATQAMPSTVNAQYTPKPSPKSAEPPTSGNEVDPNQMAPGMGNPVPAQKPSLLSKQSTKMVKPNMSKKPVRSIADLIARKNAMLNKTPGSLANGPGIPSQPKKLTALEPKTPTMSNKLPNGFKNG